MNFKKDKGIITPTKGYKTDAAWDIYSPKDFDVLSHNFSERIDLGIAFEIPEGYCGLIAERSSQGKIGISSIGPLIDHGYIGNVHVTLVNHGYDSYRVKKGDRICQLLVIPVYQEKLIEVTKLSKTTRGEKNHGSSGK